MKSHAQTAEKGLRYLRAQHEMIYLDLARRILRGHETLEKVGIFADEYMYLVVDRRYLFLQAVVLLG